MNSTGMANKPEQNLPSESGGTLTAVGGTSRHKSSPLPVEAEFFFLTSIFIELTDVILVCSQMGLTTLRKSFALSLRTSVISLLIINNY
jgi:hypothetical protein